MKYFLLLEYHGMIEIPVKLRHFAAFLRCLLINMHRINIFGGEKGIVKCVDRGWSVVIPPKFSDQLSWKWRQQTSKSAMFLASLACACPVSSIYIWSENLVAKSEAKDGGN